VQHTVSSHGMKRQLLLGQADAQAERFIVEVSEAQVACLSLHTEYSEKCERHRF